ncbi:FMN-binding negative transcriptional regulator [Flavobacterium sp. CYK-4]|uniref:FMN-binding negative transcriptional regulator n=1 Tax=Flavobacterium lotistagni TaxID=2709660 RepID=UPI00140DDC37|nr:FMN-binding negative transcriptional regulator [Flavobacterium lotistagni]NHM06008.1 FMN-binding negative transcriptional regulator [Flavobacterium lotistagni]
MYVPKENRMTDTAAILDFMQRFSFAMIITAENNIPIATHLPFLVRLEDEKFTLTAHFAKANPQWKSIENNPVLVVFSEPHAYISPKLYDKELNVPTWNYLAVHAYGKSKLITDAVAVREVLNTTVQHFEIGYNEQWKRLPEDYKLALSEEIVAFEIEVTELQAKKKISQNKTEAEKNRIIDALSKSTDSNQQLIAEYMRKK